VEVTPQSSVHIEKVKAPCRMRATRKREISLTLQKRNTNTPLALTGKSARVVARVEPARATTLKRPGEQAPHLQTRRSPRILSEPKCVAGALPRNTSGKLASGQTSSPLVSSDTATER